MLWLMRSIVNDLAMFALISLTIVDLFIPWMSSYWRESGKWEIISISLLNIYEESTDTNLTTETKSISIGNAKDEVCQSQGESECASISAQYRVSSASFAIQVTVLVSFILSFSFLHAKRYPQFISSAIFYFGTALSASVVFLYAFGSQKSVTLPSDLSLSATVIFSSGFFIAISIAAFGLWSSTTLQYIIHAKKSQ